MILQNENETDILCITESWLNSTVSDREILIPGFSSNERIDREGSKGRGLLLFIKPNISYIRGTDLEITELMSLWIELLYKNSPNVLLGTIYRPPNQNNSKWKKY